MAISPRQIQGLKLLAKSLPELRSEILAEMAANPAIDDVEHVLETPLSEVEKSHAEEEREPDYPEDDFEPGGNRDEEAADRRQAFFDSQVKEETLQDHLLEQLPLSDIPAADWPMVETLVGDLDDNGYYKGSIPDVAMAFGRSEGEVRAALRRISEFDPAGCGALDARDCLLAQTDAIENGAVRKLVERIVADHLENLAAGRIDEIVRALGSDAEEVRAAIRALRSLDGRPGRRFPSARDRVEYVNPEIHAVRKDGRWLAQTDARSLPEIRLSKTFAALLEDPAQSEETKAYVRERIEAAKSFRCAVAKRQETVAAIAQTIFDRQQEFFEQGFKALKPLTEGEIAKAVGVSGATVSRTVRDKYAATPRGTIELRRFLSAGLRFGETLVSQDAVLAALNAEVAAETEPLSDEKLAAALKAKGFSIARRTVAKYREKLGIPSASERRGGTGR